MHWGYNDLYVTEWLYGCTFLSEIPTSLWKRFTIRRILNKLRYDVLYFHAHTKALRNRIDDKNAELVIKAKCIKKISSKDVDLLKEARQEVMDFLQTIETNRRYIAYVDQEEQYLLYLCNKPWFKLF